MKSLRLLVACAILRGAGMLAEVVAGPALSEKPPLRPIDRMLLGSIVGVFIAGIWIWVSTRVGR